MLLYIIRHGDPDYEHDCLTPKGKLQAQALAKRLAVHGLDKIFCSPLGRAKQTAEPTCALLGLPMSIEEWTSENLAWNDFSVPLEHSGRTWCFHVQNTDYKNDGTISLMEHWHTAESFRGANVQKGYQRIMDASDDFLARLGYRRKGSVYEITAPNDQRIAVFCHQGFGTTWISHLLRIPPHLFWASFDLSHSSVTILEWKNNSNGMTAPQCLMLSDLSHIYREGLPLQYNNTIDL